MPPPRKHVPAAGTAATTAAVAAAEELIAVAPLATRWIERLLAQHEPPLTVPQYLALREIGQGDVSGSELARRTGVSGPAVSQLLTGLANARLLERRTDVNDRRRHALTLSPLGERISRSAQVLLREHLSAMLAELPRPEVDALSRLLPRVQAALAGTSPPRRRPPPPPPRARQHERDRPR